MMSSMRAYELITHSGVLQLHTSQHTADASTQADVMTVHLGPVDYSLLNPAW